MDYVYMLRFIIARYRFIYDCLKPRYVIQTYKKKQILIIIILSIDQFLFSLDMYQDFIKFINVSLDF